MMQIRCPHCDIAFSVDDSEPDPEIQCPGCKNVLGRLSDSRKQVEQPVEVRLTATLEGHTGSVLALAVSPDGQTLASASMDHTVILWNLTTFEQQAVLRDGDQPLIAAMFSPDGKWLITKDGKGIVTAWDVATRESPITIATNTGDPAIAFSPDGTLLATGGFKIVRFWDTETWRERFSLPDLERTVRMARFSPDGQSLAIGLEGKADPNVQLWSMAGLQQQAGFAHNGLTCMNFSPDGQLLVCGNMSGVVRVWDVAAGQDKLTFSPMGRNQYFMPSPILGVAFASDSRWLALGLYMSGSNVQLWDMRAWQIRAVIAGHKGRVPSLAFLPDSQTLITGGDDKIIRRWSLITE